MRPAMSATNLGTSASNARTINVPSVLPGPLDTSSPVAPDNPLTSVLGFPWSTDLPWWQPDLPGTVIPHTPSSHPTPPRPTALPPPPHAAAAAVQSSQLSHSAVHLDNPLPPQTTAPRCYLMTLSTTRVMPTLRAALLGIHLISKDDLRMVL
ncbi:hypothetical protein JVU11DRAFT_10843 [Chiua virens]|nr:hypothetical protein JVU11DRAFT_10843 [Chiua virens]